MPTSTKSPAAAAQRSFRTSPTALLLAVRRKIVESADYLSSYLSHAIRQPSHFAALPESTRGLQEAHRGPKQATLACAVSVSGPICAVEALASVILGGRPLSGRPRALQEEERRDVGCVWT